MLRASRLENDQEEDEGEAEREGEEEALHSEKGWRNRRHPKRDKGFANVLPRSSSTFSSPSPLRPLETADFGDFDAFEACRCCTAAIFVCTYSSRNMSDVLAGVRTVGKHSLFLRSVGNISFEFIPM